MAEDLIRYDILVQDALRGIVRKVLNEVGKTGLPGEHHLYVSFETTAPGVMISPRLLGEYPTEMTIVLQHQFWDLIVTETYFEVGLSFGGVAEKLHVPFSAIKGFFDPSVQFHLQFEPYNPEEEGETGDEEEAMRVAILENEEAARLAEHLNETVEIDDVAENETPTAANGDEATSDGDTRKSDDDKAASAEVVSLDAFRKKT